MDSKRGLLGSRSPFTYLFVVIFNSFNFLTNQRNPHFNIGLKFSAITKKILRKTWNSFDGTFVRPL